MLKTFQNIDFLSKTPQLYINGSNRFKSLIGACLSIIIIVVGIAGFSFFFSKLLDREEPNVSISTKYNPYSNFTLNTSEFTIAFGLTDALGETLDSSYYSGFAQNWKYFYENGKNQTIIRTNLKLSKCNNISRISNFELYKDVQHRISNFLCLDPNQTINIYSPFASDFNHSYINFYITYCTQQSNCKNSSEIFKKLSTYYFTIYTPNYYVDSLNFTNPIQPYIRSFAEISTTSFFKRTYYYLKNILYYSDKGLILNDEHNTSNTIYQDSKTIIDLRDTELFGGKLLYQFTYAFNEQGNEDYILRNYKRIQNVIAEIGGFINSLRLIATFFLEMYYDLKLYSLVAEKFTFIKNEKSQINTTNNEFKRRDSVKIKNTQSKNSKYKKIRLKMHEIFLLCKKKINFKKAKNMFVNYYFEILNMINYRNEINALKYILLNKKDINFYDSLSRMIYLEILENKNRVSGHETKGIESLENEKLKKYFNNI